MLRGRGWGETLRGRSGGGGVRRMGRPSWSAVGKWYRKSVGERDSKTVGERDRKSVAQQVD